MKPFITETMGAEHGPTILHVLIYSYVEIFNVLSWNVSSGFGDL